MYLVAAEIQYNIQKTQNTYTLKTIHNTKITNTITQNYKHNTQNAEHFSGKVGKYWRFGRICCLHLYNFSDIKMKAEGRSKISVLIYQTTRRHIPSKREIALWKNIFIMVFNVPCSIQTITPHLPQYGEERSKQAKVSLIQSNWNASGVHLTTKVVKWPERESDPSPLSNAQVNNTWGYMQIHSPLPPLHMDNFTIALATSRQVAQLFLRSWK
jgi:hypothetical protein